MFCTLFLLRTKDNVGSSSYVNPYPPPVVISKNAKFFSLLLLLSPDIRLPAHDSSFIISNLQNKLC